MHIRLLFTLFSLVPLLLLGCGGANGLAPVEGVVTFDGKPLPNANVIFEGQGPKGDSATAYTDDEGHYRLKDTIRDFGAKPGNYIVRITAQPADEYSEPPAVPPKYNVNSNLTATVKEGHNSFDFDLQSDPNYRSVER